MIGPPLGLALDQPVPGDPVDGVDLEHYARVSAKLAAQPKQRAAVLAQEGFDETRWLVVEQAWGLRLAAAALRGELELLQRYDSAFTRAQDEAGAPEISLADYARLVARIERGQPPPAACLALGLPDSAWPVLQRRFAQRLAKNIAETKELRTLVDAELVKLGP